MRLAHLASALVVASALGGGLALAQVETSQVQDTPMDVNGVETVCTGVGLEARSDPKWKAYPLHVEFVGKGGQMLGDAKVSITGGGKTFDITCKGPWLLMKLPAGSYHLAADLSDPGTGHKEMNVRVPGHYVIRYPNSGGEISKNKEQIASR